MSASRLSPIIQAPSNVVPARRAASVNISGSGFDAPTSPAMHTASASSSRPVARIFWSCVEVGPFVTTASDQPAARTSDSTVRTPGVSR